MNFEHRDPVTGLLSCCHIAPLLLKAGGSKPAFHFMLPIIHTTPRFLSEMPFQLRGRQNAFQKKPVVFSTQSPLEAGQYFQTSLLPSFLER